MEQRFTWNGEQYEQKTFDYPDKHYDLNSNIPPQSYWSNHVPTDTYDDYPPDKGLMDFHHYYACNSGIPGPFRPRPVKTSTPIFSANGLQQLFYETRDLKYTTENGQPPPAPVPNRGDPLVAQYNYDNDVPRKENCGCGAGPLLPIHG